MSWEVLATGLSIIMLVAVTAITLVGVMGVADPLLLTRCRECTRPMLDFQHIHTLCRHCRPDHASVTGHLLHLVHVPAHAGHLTHGIVKDHRR